MVSVWKDAVTLYNRQVGVADHRLHLLCMVII